MEFDVVILVRHGENQKTGDLALNPEGVRWATSLATEIGRLGNPDAIFYQTVNLGDRCKDTVEPLGRALGLPLRQVAIFGENSATAVGRWQSAFRQAAADGAACAVICFGASFYADLLTALGLDGHIRFGNTPAERQAQYSTITVVTKTPAGPRIETVRWPPAT